MKTTSECNIPLFTFVNQKQQVTSLEICAGAGGQALGLENAGFKHLALVEIEPLACETLRINKPYWNVIESDVKMFSAIPYRGQVDLFAGGVPCQPFSHGGNQLGEFDERDLFPEALRLIKECEPNALLLENVRGLLDNEFYDYRQRILTFLSELGYKCDWKLLNSSDFGVSQLRPRAILVGFKKEIFDYFEWPIKNQIQPLSVGDLLFNEMASEGWEFAEEWRIKANGIAPTLVGGSKKHGGADLGPTRAKQQWAKLGVDGRGVANTPPPNGSTSMPRLTLRMTAMIQGFPPEWKFMGKKTPAYRQIGNAFPPPVAQAVGSAIRDAITCYQSNRVNLVRNN